MIGILAEKPSASRNFAKALGGMSGTYQGQQYMIVASRGHLYEFMDPEKQVPAALAEQYHSWDLQYLPWDETQLAWKREPRKTVGKNGKASNADAKALLKTLKEQLSKCSEIVIATDVDPSGEGELLAWEILDELKLKPAVISRMYFMDESAPEIQKAFLNRKVIPSMTGDSDYVKAFYRSQFDYLTMQFTRIATKYGDGRSVLRQGRLKSAMILIVGDALKALSEYKKIPYYQNRFRDENGIVYTNPDEPQFSDKTSVPQTYHGSSVTCDKKAMKASAPPKLIDLAGLSAKLSTKGIKAKQVLDTYQKMYEDQVVSYPRTEDACITPEQFNELLPLVDKIAGVVGVNPGLLTHRTARPTHVKTGGAHGANRPGPNVPSSMTEIAGKYGPAGEAIYDVLAHNYLAMLAEDYEYEHQEGHVTDYPAFRGSTNVPVKAGWKAVYMDEDDNMDGKPLGTRAEPFIYEGFPPKPPKPTMKWLMKQLEKYDVGTGATRTSTYADVTNERSRYPLLVEKRGALSMARCGEMSYRLLPGTCIGDLKLTEQLQADMRSVAAGTLNPMSALAKVADMVRKDLDVMKANSEILHKEMGTMSDFPEKEKYEGVWNGTPVKFNRTFRGKRLSDDECAELCSGATIEVRGLTAKSGKQYGVTARLNNLEYNGYKYVGVEQVDFIHDFPTEWCGHKLTADETAMLKAGHPIEVNDAVSKRTGKKFSCKLTWGKRDDGSMGLIPSFN